jgi:predicted RNase H-like HicB family nuclease
MEFGKDVTMLEYHAAYYPIEDGWYMAKVLDFPGTITQGKTLASARRMAKDSHKLMAECLLERGEPLPRPNPRARDKKAELIESIGLVIRTRTPVQL